MKWLVVALVAASCTGQPPIALPPAGPATHTLRVVAAGADGPVAGLRVCASTLSGARSCTPTGPDGIATFTLPAGTYQVRSEAPASQRRVDADGVPVGGQGGAPVGVDLSTGDSSVRLQFETVRRISGRITDPSSQPVPLAPVCANPLSLAATVCEKSRTDGTYAIDVTPGFYKLSVDGGPGLRLLSQWAFGRVNSGEADVIDVRTADATGVDVTLRQGVVLQGTITNTAGQPVKKAQVCTHRFSASLPWECERTDDHGHYVALREPDTYWVWVIPSDDDVLLMQWFDDAGVGVGATPVDLSRDRVIDQMLGPGPSIVGHVTDPTGAPVFHAFVCVDTPFPTGRICRPTDASGAYRVTTRPETYLVQVLPPDGSDLVPQYVGGGRTWLDAATVTLRNADRTVDVSLVRGVKVSGVIRSQAGVPLEGASVNVSDAQGIVTATYTDETGAYSVAVPAGRYTFDFFAPFPSQVVSVEGRPVTVDKPMTMDVTLADANP
ncbi:MAG TPA: carboxypeptidase-like regulatory domain-containing protein [Candidatus Limnocylindria bacterium]|nr:carboxypeptidase-like regulatory domain-containing protein [Candidatus Limnocylindria bacterium]